MELNNSLFYIPSNLNGIRVSLFDVADWKNGLAFKNIDFSMDGLPVIKIAELNNGISNSTAYTNKEYSNDYHIVYGDLLFSWSGNPQTSIDAFKFNLQEGWLNQHIFKVIPKNNIDKNFLFYVLKYLKPNFTEIATNKQTIGLGHVTLSDIKQISMILPPLDVQRKIAGVLSALDDKIELNNRINQNLESQARSLFDEIYTSEPNGTLSEIIEVVETGNRPKGGACSSGIPSIGAENIEKFGVYDFSKEKFINKDFYEEMKRGKVKSGDVLLYKDGAYTGKVSMALDDFPHKICAVNEHVFTLRCNNKCTQFFLYFCLSNEKNKAYLHNLACSKAAQPGLNQQELLSLPVFIPKFEKIEKFTDMISPFMHKIAQNALENIKLAKIRDALLPKLMSGEIDVENLPPSAIIPNE